MDDRHHKSSRVIASYRNREQKWAMLGTSHQDWRSCGAAGEDLAPSGMSTGGDGDRDSEAFLFLDTDSRFFSLSFSLSFFFLSLSLLFSFSLVVFTLPPLSVLSILATFDLSFLAEASEFFPAEGEDDVFLATFEDDDLDLLSDTFAFFLVGLDDLDLDDPVGGFDAAISVDFLVSLVFAFFDLEGDWLSPPFLVVPLLDPLDFEEAAIMVLALRASKSSVIGIEHSSLQAQKTFGFGTPSYQRQEFLIKSYKNSQESFKT